MSENEERQERADPTTPPSSDAAAWAVLGAVSRQSAEEFIAEQKKVAQKQQMLLDLQAHELKHELSLRHWSLRVHHVSDVMKVSFEIAVALIMIAVALFIGGAVWSAAHDDGLVIQAFSVPPDLAARGMTGEVVAGRMLDRLSDLQAQTESMRNPGSYTNNWGNDIKVQIPDTGVSVGEFNRYLHQWLGHETNITGDVVRTANGLTVTARAGSDAGDSFTGPEADLDSLPRRYTPARSLIATVRFFTSMTSSCRRWRFSPAMRKAARPKNGPGPMSAGPTLSVRKTPFGSRKINPARRYR